MSDSESDVKYFGKSRSQQEDDNKELQLELQGY